MIVTIHEGLKPDLYDVKFKYVEILPEVVELDGRRSRLLEVGHLGDKEGGVKATIFGFILGTHHGGCQMPAGAIQLNLEMKSKNFKIFFVWSNHEFKISPVNFHNI